MFVDGLKSQTGSRSLTFILIIYNFILIRISFVWCLESQDPSFFLRQVVIAIEFAQCLGSGCPNLDRIPVFKTPRLRRQVRFGNRRYFASQPQRATVGFPMFPNVSIHGNTNHGISMEMWSWKCYRKYPWSMEYGCVWKCCVAHCTQWFCWSLSRF